MGFSGTTLTLYLNLVSHSYQENLPHVLPHMRNDLGCLWREYQATIVSGVKPRLLNDPSLGLILARRLETVFSVTWGVAVHIAMALEWPVPESAWRHEWDTLGYSFYTTVLEPVSTQLL